MNLKDLRKGIIVKSKIDGIVSVVVVKGEFDIDRLQNAVDEITQEHWNYNDIQILQELQELYPELEMEYIDRLYDLNI